MKRKSPEKKERAWNRLFCSELSLPHAEEHRFGMEEMDLRTRKAVKGSQKLLEALLAYEAKYGQR